MTARSTLPNTKAAQWPRQNATLSQKYGRCMRRIILASAAGTFMRVTSVKAGKGPGESIWIMPLSVMHDQRISQTAIAICATGNAQVSLRRIRTLCSRCSLTCDQTNSTRCPEKFSTGQRERVHGLAG